MSRSNIKALGTALEYRIVAWAKARGLKAKRQPGSGAWAGLPHDAVVWVDTAPFLIEAKVRATTLTQRGQRMLPIDLDWYDRVRRDARREGYDEGLLVVNAKGSRTPLVVCDLMWLLDLLAEVDEGRRNARGNIDSDGENKTGTNVG